jgi:hypothetical protein
LQARARIPAIAVGLAAAFLLSPPASLADPPDCAGLLELIGIIASRTVRDVPLAEMIGWGNRVIVAFAVLLFARLLQSRFDSLVMLLSAAAIVTALIASDAFTPLLAPTAAAPFAVACAALLIVTRDRGTGRSLTAGGFVRLSMVLALLVAIAPPLLVPCAIAAVALAPSVIFGLGGVAALALGPLIIHVAVTPLPTVGDGARSALSCVVPTTATADGVGLAAEAAFGRISLFAIALTALGAFAMRVGWRSSRTWWMALFALLPIAVATGGPVDSMRTFAPALAAFWMLAAIGLRELVLALRPAGWRWIIVCGVLAAVPWLQLARQAGFELPDADRIRGHDRLTRQNFLQLMSAVLPGSVLVVEDAVASLLAHDVGRRLAASGRPLLVAGRNFEAVSRAISNARVFALPRAQNRG